MKIIKKLHLYGEMVMFSHTLFSLPFALLTMFIAAKGLPELNLVMWSVIALVGARTGANAFNRYADRFIDAKNPRTQERHIPKGILKSYEALVVTLFSYLVYFIAAYNINILCFVFSPIPLILFTIYPYTKRFTSLCHIVLGIACSLAVIGAWMAVKNELLFITYNNSLNKIEIININYIPVIISIAVALWNAGFDTIYGTQDIEFDRLNHIFSIPAKFGLKTALLIAKTFHFMMILLLLSLIFFTSLSTLYIIGLGISSILFLFEHRIVKPNNTILMKLASYKLNQIISLTIFIFTSLDIFI